jgi:hypothetical protein
VLGNYAGRVVIVHRRNGGGARIDSQYSAEGGVDRDIIRSVAK